MFPQMFGKYVLDAELAAGGMARVFRATLRGAGGFEKRLVVKQIRPELASDDAFVRRFVDEAKTAVELGHPNIVPVYELGVEQGTYYIAMEFCEGVTLAELLLETGPLSPEEGAYVGVEICRALDYAHRRAGIVHRDVTPRNVMIDDEGAVRLIDFGIAAPAASAAGGERVAVEVFGSPGHMPPEQLAGAALTPATDVFAVGALLLEAWSGSPPFRRATAVESEHALTASPPPPSARSPRLAPLDELVTASVALEPARRPARAELLARPLREFLKSADLGDVARRLGERARRARRSGRRSEPWLDRTPASEPRPGDATPPRPAPATHAGEPVTRTFAVRDDLVEWTRKLSPNAEPVATRRLERAPPIASAAAGSGRRAGLLAALVASAVLFAWIGQRWRSGAQPREAGSARSPAGLGSSHAAARGSTAEPWRDAGDSAANLALAPIPDTSSGNHAATPPEPAAPVAPPAVPSGSSAGPRAGPTTNPRPGASAAEPAPGRSTLSLTSAPPASVMVGGRRFASTPVLGLSLPPGTYPVLFRSLGVLDERVSATVTLGPGESRGVHADFTSASPRVILR
ncbi:MAG: protein kinase [Sorangiineae bacterium]|nr:protein kinase [Polyangiaceae bacterium]MEB2324883.1 protein kinase [Sorangiineae bacterium]